MATWVVSVKIDSRSTGARVVVPVTIEARTALEAFHGAYELIRSFGHWVSTGLPERKGK